MQARAIHKQMSNARSAYVALRRVVMARSSSRWQVACTQLAQALCLLKRSNFVNLTSTVRTKVVTFHSVVAFFPGRLEPSHRGTLSVSVSVVFCLVPTRLLQARCRAITCTHVTLTPLNDNQPNLPAPPPARQSYCHVLGLPYAQLRFWA
jgi:hypothetical protein